MEERTYAAAGVSLATADSVVERLRAAVESTGAAGFGAFAGIYPLDDRKLLAASTDGVGTKLILARERGAARLRRRPRGALHQRRADDRRRPALPPRLRGREPDLAGRGRRAGRGAAEVCRSAGVALLGGETAELPGIYRDNELDFAGPAWGWSTATGSSTARRSVKATSWSGSPPPASMNGFTLVRRVLEEEDYAGDDLLAPTRLYLDEVRALDECPRPGAHHRRRIEGNLARVVPDGLRAEIDWESWERPPSSTGSPGTSRRTSCGASSTSGSATAPSSPRRQAAK